MDLKEMTPEQHNIVKKGLEQCIFFTNKVLVQWETIQGKKQFVSDYSQVRGLLRGHIRRYLSANVDYRALSSFEYTVTVSTYVKTPYIKSMVAYSTRSGSYNRYGGTLQVLNKIFAELNYDELLYSAAAEEWRVRNNVPNVLDEGLTLRALPQEQIKGTLPEMQEELTIASIVDYGSLNKIKF